jgi:hypothetical protein
MTRGGCMHIRYKESLCLVVTYRIKGGNDVKLSRAEDDVGSAVASPTAGEGVREAARSADPWIRQTAAWG